MDNTSPVLFYWHQPGVERYWYMSNFAYTPFIVNNTRYYSAEHWLMAHKALVFGDMTIYNFIMGQTWTGPISIVDWSPNDHTKWTDLMNVIKAAGRKVAGFDEKIWAQHAISIMVEGLTHKFLAWPILLQDLLITGHRVIAEASDQDPVWGIGMWANNPAAKDIKLWKGTNWLGISLSTVRAILAIGHKK